MVTEAVVSLIESGDEVLEVQLKTPYAPDFVEALKAAFGWTHMKWDGSTMRWCFDPEDAEEVIAMTQGRFSQYTKEWISEEDADSLNLPWPSQQQACLAGIRSISDARKAAGEIDPPTRRRGRIYRVT
jgi:hypothetical protein